MGQCVAAGAEFDEVELEYEVTRPSREDVTNDLFAVEEQIVQVRSSCQAPAGSIAATVKVPSIDRQMSVVRSDLPRIMLYGLVLVSTAVARITDIFESLIEEWEVKGMQYIQGMHCVFGLLMLVTDGSYESSTATFRLLIDHIHRLYDDDCVLRDSVALLRSMVGQIIPEISVHFAIIGFDDMLFEALVMHWYYYMFVNIVPLQKAAQTVLEILREAMHNSDVIPFVMRRYAQHAIGILEENAHTIITHACPLELFMHLKQCTYTGLREYCAPAALCADILKCVEGLLATGAADFKHVQRDRHSWSSSTASSASSSDLHILYSSEESDEIVNELADSLRWTLKVDSMLLCLWCTFSFAAGVVENLRQRTATARCYMLPRKTVYTILQMVRGAVCGTVNLQAAADCRAGRLQRLALMQAMQTPPRGSSGQSHTVAEPTSGRSRTDRLDSLRQMVRNALKKMGSVARDELLDSLPGDLKWDDPKRGESGRHFKKSELLLIDMNLPH